MPSHLLTFPPSLHAHALPPAHPLTGSKSHSRPPTCSPTRLLSATLTSIRLYSGMRTPFRRLSVTLAPLTLQAHPPDAHPPPYLSLRRRSGDRRSHRCSHSHAQALRASPTLSRRERRAWPRSWRPARIRSWKAWPLSWRLERPRGLSRGGRRAWRGLMAAGAQAVLAKMRELRPLSASR